MLTSYSHYHQVQPENMNLYSISTIPLVFALKKFFSYLVPNARNNCPPHIVEFISLKIFKANLDVCLTDNMCIFV